MATSSSTVGLLLALTGALVACSKSEPAADSLKRDDQQALAPAAPSHENENYKVTIEPVGSCKTGRPCLANIALVAKRDYHINKQYPYKFVTQDPPADAVTYPKKVVPRGDGTYEEKRAILPVPFVASKQGEIPVGGTFSLSVCTDASCLIDKQRLETTVKVE